MLVECARIGLVRREGREEEETMASATDESKSKQDERIHHCFSCGPGHVARGSHACQKAHSPDAVCLSVLSRFLSLSLNNFYLNGLYTCCLNIRSKRWSHINVLSWHSRETSIFQNSPPSEVTCSGLLICLFFLFSSFSLLFASLSYSTMRPHPPGQPCLCFSSGVHLAHRQLDETQRKHNLKRSMHHSKLQSRESLCN